MIHLWGSVFYDCFEIGDSLAIIGCFSERCNVDKRLCVCCSAQGHYLNVLESAAHIPIILMCSAHVQM